MRYAAYKKGEIVYMGMTSRHTSAANLQKALNSSLVTIKLVSVESKDSHETSEIPAEQFKNDLDLYLESGIFADSIDFKYELSGNVCITVEMVINDGVDKKDLENVIRKVDL